MAVQAPPSAHTPPPPAPAAPRRRRGCGCGGCLLSLLLIVLLAGAGIYFFAVLPASAGAPAPATLTVYLDRVETGGAGGGFARARTGQTLGAGTTVRTDAGGRASIAFPDGSISRLAGSTSLTITEAAIDGQGGLHRALLTQDVGRTYHTVQSLLNGGRFTVQGHGVTADVRGTEFEMWIKADHSALIKLFKGRLHVGAGGAVDQVAGQQVAISATGQVSPAQPIAPDPEDPFAIWTGPAGSETVAAAGNQPGSMQTSPAAAPISAAGQPADTATYQFPGGDLTAVLSYPGSRMRLEVVGPSGQVVGAAEGPPPVRVSIPGAAPGAYHGRVIGRVLDHGPERWSVTFASNPPCALAKPAGAVAPGQPVRATISDAQLNAALAANGVAGSSIHISPTAGGATLSGTVTSGGVNVSATAVIFATPPTIGVVLASASIQGVNITTQVSSQAAQLSGQALQSMNIGFAVDRVYSCRGRDGGLLVIEGHGQ